MKQEQDDKIIHDLTRFCTLTCFWFLKGKSY